MSKGPADDLQTEFDMLSHKTLNSKNKSPLSKEP